MVYMNLDKEFFESNVKEANENAIKEFENDDSGKNCLLFELDADECRIDEIDGNKIDVAAEGKFGYISFKVKLGDEDFIKVVEATIKKMNKLKNVFESLK